MLHEEKDKHTSKTITAGDYGKIRKSTKENRGKQK